MIMPLLFPWGMLKFGGIVVPNILTLYLGVPLQVCIAMTSIIRASKVVLDIVIMRFLEALMRFWPELKIPINQTTEVRVRRST